MTETLEMTFADLLPKEIEGLGAQIRSQAGDRAGSVAWPLVEHQAFEGLRKTLGAINLAEQIAQAWTTLSVLHAYRHPDPAAPGATAILPLGKHALNLRASPALQLSLGSWKAPKLTLSYGVALTFDSASLSVRDGLLVAAAPGDCAAVVSLSCGAVPLHKPWTIAQVELPGRLNFSPGWKIP